jgi:anti-sigma B factor antagonist
VHRVASELNGARAVVVASGELDAYAAPDLERELATVRGKRAVIVDLSQASFLDSTALGLVVRATRELEEDGTAVRVVLPQGTARRIFEITALDRVLPTASTRQAGLGELDS